MHNVGIIIIDYLQLMSGSGDRNSNREQEISKISRDLKSLAKELKVPIIALSQLSREVEKRKETNKIPQLSDLRESGAIEQDADLVMFLFRPEYYDITANDMGENIQGETRVKIAKHRNGSLDTIKLKAKLEIQKFVEYEGNDAIPGLPSGGGSWKPVSETGFEGGGARMFIQKGSKMNEGDFSNEVEPDDDPF
jgi:replicative DNA helicase